MVTTLVRCRCKTSAVPAFSKLFHNVIRNSIHHISRDIFTRVVPIPELTLGIGHLLHHRVLVDIGIPHLTSQLIRINLLSRSLLGTLLLIANPEPILLQVLRPLHEVSVVLLGMRTGLHLETLPAIPVGFMGDTTPPDPSDQAESVGLTPDFSTEDGPGDE